ncbi:MAG: site-specific integrase [Syntrophorhabdales bacterium]|jgi:integrase
MASLKKRGKRYYMQYYVGKKKVTKSLGTSSLQIAKEKLRQHESASFRGEEVVMPTRTPIAEVVGAFVGNMIGKKRMRNAAKDVYYLREAFGPVCPELQIKNEKISRKGKKSSSIKACRRIEASYFEWVRTADVAAAIAEHVRYKGIKGKTANRFREVLVRLYNWAIKEGGVKMPGNVNPAAAVERYKETAPVIRFLDRDQIDEQLAALRDQPVLQVMVAIYIYAGLRREELLWLTLDDVDSGAGPRGVIRIRAKEAGGEFWQPKTGKNRIVPISRTLKTHLDAYIPRRVEGSWYFPSPEGKRWDTDNFSQSLREANRKAGLKWACLDFRHTFGSHLAMKGESLYKISELMGNSPEICRKHYAHLMPESLVDSVEFGETGAHLESPDPMAPLSPSGGDDRQPPKRLRLVVANSKVVKSR